MVAKQTHKANSVPSIAPIADSTLTEEIHTKLDEIVSLISNIGYNIDSTTSRLLTSGEGVAGGSEPEDKMGVSTTSLIDAKIRLGYIAQTLSSTLDASNKLLTI